MREIKFRAWNIEIKEMIYLENSGLQFFDFEGNYSLGFTVDGYSGFWAHEQYDSPTKKAKLFPIMQYTGLKDKNGKEIYEGDLCLLYNPYNGLPALGCAQVIFSYAYVGGWVLTSNHGDLLNIGTRTKDIEIIGNIHKNPDLLI
jgi:uncharacterized phage protein (TIGR01671 family)